MNHGKAASCGLIDGAGQGVLRRAFTVIELVLALVLGTIIVISATAVFGLVGVSENRLSASFDDAAQLSIAQRVLRKSMSSLVASKPEDPQVTAGQAKARETGEGFDDTGVPLGEGEEKDQKDGAAGELRDAIAGATGDSALAEELTRKGDQRAYFELYYDTSGPGSNPLQSFEVVVLESPVPASADAFAADEDANLTRFLPVRGVFEVLRLDDSLALQWRPIEPPGPPTLLVRGLDSIEWWLLPRARHGREWIDVSAAYLQEDFPVAVRLLMWTKNGSHVDWLFDTAVSTPEGM
jgi:hypothetical protein